MFGDNRKLQRKLREKGCQARAEVLEAERTNRTLTRGNDSIAAATKVIWKLKLRVQPTDEPAFEVEIKDGWDQFGSPRAGTQVPVLYDPDDHSKVVLDDSDQAAIDTFMADSKEKEAARGIGEKDASTMDELKREAIADPEAFRRRMSSLRKGGDGPTVVSGADALAKLAGDPGPKSTPEVDRVEQLTKLADLRDRGVLSNEEFEQQKRRILGD
jgi:hypothetical protein